MRLGRVRPDDDDDVAAVDRLEVLRAGRGAEGLLQAEASGGVADPGAGVDVVVAEGGPHHLLHDEDLFVRAARGRDPADGTDAVASLDRSQAISRVGDGLFPAHDPPRVCDRLTDHRRQHALFVRRVSPGEASLHARMTLVRPSVLVGDHADDLVAAQLGFERAADPAVRAGGDHGAARHAQVDDGLLLERRGRAGLHARAARNALRAQEVACPRRNLRAETPARDREGEGALDLLAGPHAARADDALGAVEGEIGVALVLLGVQVVVTCVAVADVAKADGTGHVLQLAVPVRGAGQAVQRMVRDVQLHDAATELLEARGLGRDLHPGLDRSRAGRRRAAPAGDLDEAKAARAEGRQGVGGAQLGHVDARDRRRAHERGAFGHCHGQTVDLQLHCRRTWSSRRSEVVLLEQRHDCSPRVSDDFRLDLTADRSLAIMAPRRRELCRALTAGPPWAG